MIKSKENNISKRHIILIILSILIIIALILLIYMICFRKSKNIESGNNQIIDDKHNIKINEKIEDIQNKELFEDYYIKADKILEGMTLREKIGQMFLARCPESGQIEEIKELAPAGYILFARDFQNETKDSVISKIKSYQNASKIKMLIAVDEEGGAVTRVSKYSEFRSENFKSLQELYNIGGIDLIKSDTKEKIELLKLLGINLNLAPVADVSTNSEDYIYKRTVGQDASITSDVIKESTLIYNANKMGMSLKHFPGYGNNKDTHTDFVRDDRNKEQFETVDLIPFKAGIKNNAQSILVSHNIVSYKDSKNPVSLSKVWHEFLRNELNFTGVIITDDLAMGAIANIYTVDEAAIKAVSAKNDLIITSDLKGCVDAVYNAVVNKKLNEEDINVAVRRVLSWKFYLDVL